VKVRAPGKLMLAGEYAALYGGDAWCLAVDRYAVVDDAVSPGGFTPPEAIAAWRVAVEAGLLRAMPAEGSARFDLTQLGWAVAREQGERAMPQRRDEIARCAREGHRAVQGGGSGVDVLTSAFGGTVLVRFSDGVDRPPTVEQKRLPDVLRWRVFWSGTSVRTSDMIAKVEALRGASPSVHAACIDAIRGATDLFEHASRNEETARCVTAVQHLNAAMAALGDAAGAPIVTPAMARLAARIEQFGAAVKPSGAGGGDVVVGFAQDDRAMAALREAAAIEGFEEVELAADVGGLGRVQEGERGRA
jgi:phosphomevalonate kinase